MKDRQFQQMATLSCAFEKRFCSVLLYRFFVSLYKVKVVRWLSSPFYVCKCNNHTWYDYGNILYIIISNSGCAKHYSAMCTHYKVAVGHISTNNNII